MKLREYQRRALRRALKELRRNPGKLNPRLGICWHLDQLVVQGACYLNTYRFVGFYAADWPSRTGEVHDDDGVWLSTWPIKRDYSADGSREPLWEGWQLQERLGLIDYLLTKVA